MSFQVVAKVRAPAAPRPEEAAAAAARRAEIEAAVAAEVARRRAAAEEEGRREGEAQAARALAAREAALAAAAAALEAACGQLAAPLAQHEAKLAELVMELAFEMARHVVGVTVAADGAGLSALVETLLREAAAERGPRQDVVVRVNPADHAVIAAINATEGVLLLADAAVAAGGAKVELVAPEGDPLEKSEWDATVEARLAALREALWRV